MEDVAPELLEEIQQVFKDLLATRPRIKALYSRIFRGDASYIQAQDYADEVGKALSQAFGTVLHGDVLPDGKMYYNIADRVLRPMLVEDYNLVAAAAEQVEKTLNARAGIGLKPLVADLDEERVQNIIEKVAAAEEFDSVAWMLQESVITNFSMCIVDETIRENARMHSNAGLHPKIIRKAESGCCKWCSGLQGTFDYPEDIPDDVFRRHNDCRCTVEYDPADGRKERQNVHTKRWNSDADPDIIEQRRKMDLAKKSFSVGEFENRIAKRVHIDSGAALEAAKKGKRHGGVYRDAAQKTKRQLEKSIISRTAEVERHFDKMSNPEKYIGNWELKTEVEKKGLIEKWRKDAKRNAEQASIEAAVYKERF